MTDLIHLPAHIIKTWVVAEGIGNDTQGAQWQTFVNTLPDMAGIHNNILSVFDTTGVLDGKNVKGVVTEYFGWQIRVRTSANQQQLGGQKIWDIRNRVDKVKRYQVEIDGTTYIIGSLRRSSSVLPLGQEPEGAGRWGFTINGTATISQL